MKEAKYLRNNMTKTCSSLYLSFKDWSTCDPIQMLACCVAFHTQLRSILPMDYRF